MRKPAIIPQYRCNKLFYIKQGKFIRIHFGTTGKLASADIETCKYEIHS